MNESSFLYRHFKSFFDLLRFVLKVIVIAYILATSKRRWFSRILFWPLFVFSSLMVTIPLYFIIYLFTFYLPDNFYVVHFGETYYSSFGSKYEYSFDVLFILLSFFSGWITWRIVNEYELILYKSNSIVSKVEIIFGVVFGVLVLFYLFNLTSSPIHKHFFADMFDYYSKNPFVYDK